MVYWFDLQREHEASTKQKDNKAAIEEEQKENYFL